MAEPNWQAKWSIGTIACDSGIYGLFDTMMLSELHCLLNAMMMIKNLLFGHLKKPDGWWLTRDLLLIDVLTTTKFRNSGLEDPVTNFHLITALKYAARQTHNNITIAASIE